MRYTVKVFMRGGKKVSVQGVYRHQGQVVRLMNAIGEGETARTVRAAQLAEAEKKLGISADSPA